MKSRITERGQVTIPKELRDRLGLRPGQVVEFTEERGRIVLARRAMDDPVDRVYGVLELDGGTDRAVEALRGRAGQRR